MNFFLAQARISLHFYYMLKIRDNQFGPIPPQIPPPYQFQQTPLQRYFYSYINIKEGLSIFSLFALFNIGSEMTVTLSRRTRTYLKPIGLTCRTGVMRLWQIKVSCRPNNQSTL